MTSTRGSIEGTKSLSVSGSDFSDFSYRERCNFRESVLLSRRRSSAEISSKKSAISEKFALFSIIFDSDIDEPC